MDEQQARISAKLLQDKFDQLIAIQWSIAQVFSLRDCRLF